MRVNGVFSDGTGALMGAIGYMNMVNGNVTLRFGGECPSVCGRCTSLYGIKRMGPNIPCFCGSLLNASVLGFPAGSR